MEIVHEEWRPVVGLEGKYEVSNLGQVRGLDRDVTCLSRWGDLVTKVHRGRILRTWKPASGYLCVNLHHDSKRDHCQVHRLVAAAFLGEPGEMHVNHIDGDKLNNAAANLEYVTPKENIAHAMASGLMPRIGEVNPAAKNTEDQIRQAHALVLGGSTYKEASAATGAGVGAIVSCCRGAKWKSLGLQVIRRPRGFNQHSHHLGE